MLWIQSVLFGRTALRAWFKHGLVRVIAFLIVGTAVVVSTQLLRGQNPGDASSGIRQFVSGTILSWVRESDSSESLSEASAQTPSVELQSIASVDEVDLPTPKAVSFAADESAEPMLDVTGSCGVIEGSAGSIVMGDKIQLRFFAAVRVPNVDASSLPAAPSEAVAYERLDLSGIYEIAEDGTAALPLIGRIPLIDRTLACAETIVASEIAAQDGSVGTVTASFSARLPVTVSGAVRAPGTYAYSPGMTVNRLLNLAGANFGEGPVTPQEFEGLTAQRNELLYRQILAVIELGRLNANIAGKDKIVISDDLAAAVPETVVSALIDAESTALKQDLLVSRMSDQRTDVAIAGLVQKFEDTRSQLATVDTQLASLQQRNEEMTSIKSRGLIQASQLDGLLSNLMEVNRIKMQLETDQSNLESQIALAKEDAQLAVQVRMQDFSRRAAALSGEISLFDVQLSAIGARLAGHGAGSAGTDFDMPIVVSVLRSEAKGAYRLDATLDTLVLPGDMVTISLSGTQSAKQITAENDVANDAGATASGSLQP